MPLIRTLHPQASKFYDKIIRRYQKGAPTTPLERAYSFIGTTASFLGGVVSADDFGVFMEENGDLVKLAATFREPTIRGQADPIYQEIYWYAHLLKIQDVPPDFRVEENLAYCFLSTDVRGLVSEDIVLPFHSFAIEFPAGVLYTHEGLEVRTVFVTQPGSAVDLGRCISLLVLAFSGAESDLYSFHAYGVPMNPGMDLEEQQKTVDRLIAEDSDCFIVGDKTVSFREGFGLVRRYVLNFLLYIAAKPERVQHEDAERVKKLRAKGRRAHRFEQEDLFALELQHRVTTDVRIDPGIKDAVLDSGGSATWSLKYKTWVRGHWRKQACGVGRADRKLLFIAPHIRGKDLEDALVASHAYGVK